MITATSVVSKKRTGAVNESGPLTCLNRKQPEPGQLRQAENDNGPLQRMRAGANESLAVSGRAHELAFTNEYMTGYELQIRTFPQLS